MPQRFYKFLIPVHLISGAEKLRRFIMGIKDLRHWIIFYGASAFWFWICCSPAALFQLLLRFSFLKQPLTTVPCYHVASWFVGALGSVCVYMVIMGTLDSNNGEIFKSGVKGKNLRITWIGKLALQTRSSGEKTEEDIEGETKKRKSEGDQARKLCKIKETDTYKTRISQ